MKRQLFAGCLLLLACGFAACSSPTAVPPGDSPVASSSSSSLGDKDAKALTLSTAPDQDPEKLKSLYGKLAKYLEAELKVPVVYQPMASEAAAVAAFRTGAVDLVWLNGLAGVQARSPVTGAEALVQRNVDEELASVFIANKASKIAPFREQAGLKALKGHTFTFGSEQSLRDRLLPQYFLSQAGMKLSDFKNAVVFAKDADAVINAVQAGTADAGVVRADVWDQRVQQGKVDLSKMVLLWQTPAYHDFQWVIHPNVSDRFGKGFLDKVEDALRNLSAQDPSQKEILDGFGANEFIRTSNKNYQEIEKIAKELDLLK